MTALLEGTKGFMVSFITPREGVGLVQRDDILKPTICHFLCR